MNYFSAQNTLHRNFRVQTLKLQMASRIFNFQYFQNPSFHRYFLLTNKVSVNYLFVQNYFFVRNYFYVRNYFLSKITFCRKLLFVENYFLVKIYFLKNDFFEKYPGRREISVFKRTILECENYTGEQRQFLEARAERARA